MVIRLKTRKKKINPGQGEFDFTRPIEQDRNFHLGGRSFYFFDFDDNVAYLSTPIILFDKDTHEEVHISSGEFALHSKAIGKEGKYQNFYINFQDENGSFRNFRDQKLRFRDRLVGNAQAFIEDVKEALSCKHHSWKAPSWNHFVHATYNRRPVSIITARGHHPETIIEGIDLLVRDGHIPNRPNFLTIYPVNHPEVRAEFGDPHFQSSVPEMKKRAIRKSVEAAIEKYGLNHHHRFGMSDDDPANIELITEEMMELKQLYPEMSFFVIETYEDSFTKREVLAHSTRDIVSQKESIQDQLSLF